MLVLFNVGLHTKFQVPISSVSKTHGVQFFLKMGHVTVTTPIWGSSSSELKFAGKSVISVQ